MTDERERTRPDDEQGDRPEGPPEDPMVREDVQNALAAGGDLPEGGRSGMDQAVPNEGSRTVPGEPTSAESGGEEGSPHDDDGRGDIDGREPGV